MLPRKIFFEKSQWQKGGDGATPVPFLSSLCWKEKWERQEKRHCPRKGICSCGEERFQVKRSTINGCKRERLGTETGSEVAWKRMTHCQQTGLGKGSYIFETEGSHITLARYRSITQRV